MAERTQDIVVLRRRRNRRRRLYKTLLFLTVVIVAVGLYVKRDVWFPKLEGIGSRYQAIRQSDGNSAQGNFPLLISGGIDYETAELDGNLALLSDAYFYIYSLDGEQREIRQHAYAGARMETAGKRALVYESGGNRFRVESVYKTVYTGETEGQIVFARISRTGEVAVVTTSDHCACVLTVYDASGASIYTRNCVDRIMDLDFSADGDGCTAAMLTAEGGQIMSTLYSFSFASKSDRWKTEPIDTLCISVYNTNDGGVFLMGDTKCAYFDASGAMTGSYTYPATLVDGDCADGKAALLFENDTRRQTSLVMLKRSVNEPQEIEFETTAKSVRVQNGDAYVLTRSNILSYSFGGKNETTTEVADSYESFRQIDDYYFLFGYDTIDRINYEE
ncbi:MAG: hypothetical protein E7501_02615 [Ruminococcus sp.]|nr:hypothetical protein [Ruminococcus sp.]